ncbi:hypothetical protein M9Y10_002221 [Tritrichomonas musculus]|uniref:Uncharacterized protein n=1 Tax=Tritrichomonas musculus TaxID=1915356 RepID=A0ABR2LA52_9EUKA
MLTNQICKIHDAFFKTCIPANCKASFRSIGIDSNVVYVNGELVEECCFKIEECRKIRCYRIEYIQEMIRNGFQLTPNQVEILNLNQANILKGGESYFSTPLFESF